METKEMKIVPPEGYEIDKENSTFECVKFKPIEIAKTYKEVEDKLFLDVNKEYFINAQSSDKNSIFNQTCVQCVKCCSDKQLAKIIAIAKMMNVAKYLNDSATEYCSYYIYIDKSDKIGIGMQYTDNSHLYTSFNSKELAQQAISILGEETIRLALSTDW